VLSEFLKHIELQNIDWHKSKFLLSVSGGMDSMCMLDLFKSNNIEIVIFLRMETLRKKQEKNVIVF